MSQVRLPKIRQAFRDRPWLFVVAGVATFVTLFFVFVAVALLHPPELI
ncbi:MAG: hypothetical protein O2865_06065 [Planctomycetota bacterium]|jgi:hypothetical protein|nr:hypothetical protein [Planctomycetota bacterium]MDA0932453.1 hypothetical protein [Planctomycetota bacterium]MDA1221893.1 hypothetical protein [Planctomycetota bacterium]